MTLPVAFRDIEDARARLDGVALRTPVVALGSADRALLVKAESLQPVGSFKLRGAYNRLAAMSPERRARGVVAHSSGNHAQAVAWAARAFGVAATVVMPSNAPRAKREATAALGAEVVEVGPGSDERTARCAAIAEERDLDVVAPYDDPWVIAGQGTCGVEIVEQVRDVDLVLVPVSGGGLVSGVALAVKALRPSVRVVGVEPALAADAQASVRSGTRTSISGEQASRTIADGLRVQQLGALAWEVVRALVDDIVTVSDDDMRVAMRHLAHDARLVAEPSGAVSTAAWLLHRDELPRHERVVAVLSGGNVDPSLYAAVLAEAAASPASG